MKSIEYSKFTLDWICEKNLALFLSSKFIIVTIVTIETDRCHNYLKSNYLQNMIHTVAFLCTALKMADTDTS